MKKFLVIFILFFVLNISGSGSISKAEDTYIVELNGKRYYFYHQSSKSSGFNSFNSYLKTWNHNSGRTKTFPSSGCSMYTMAMIVSKLKNTPITPDRLMKDLGAEVSGTFYDLQHTGVYNTCGIPSVRKSYLAYKIAKLYNLSYAVVEPSNKEAIDYYLDKGWLGYASWQSYSGSSKNHWYNGQMHFMALRERIGDNYYCLTSAGGGSASGTIELMKRPNTFKEMYETMRNKQEGIYFFGTDESIK